MDIYGKLYHSLPPSQQIFQKFPFFSKIFLSDVKTATSNGSSKNLGYIGLPAFTCYHLSPDVITCHQSGVRGTSDVCQNMATLRFWPCTWARCPCHKKTWPRRPCYLQAFILQCTVKLCRPFFVAIDRPFGVRAGQGRLFWQFRLFHP